MRDKYGIFYRFSSIVLLSTVVSNSYAKTDLDSFYKNDRWMASASFNYLQPMSSDLNYAVVQDPSQVYNNVYSIDPVFRSSFDLFLGYFTPDKQNFFSVAYQFFYSNSSSSVTAPLGYFLGPNFETASGTDDTASTFGTPPTYAMAIGKVQYKFNQVDFMYGHLFEKHDSLVLTPIFGLRYLNFTSQFHNQYDIVTAAYSDQNPPLANDSGIFTVSPRDNAQGAGPRLALNLNYGLTQHMSLVASGGGSVIIARSTTSDIHASTTQTLYQIFPRTTTIFVPELGGKIGLRYTKNTDQYATTPLEIEVGFQAESYINLINRTTPHFDTFNSNQVLLNVTQDNSTFSLMGPYIKIGYRYY
jgi:hypothetical protein